MSEATGKITRIYNDLYANKMKIIKRLLFHFSMWVSFWKVSNNNLQSKEAHWGHSHGTGITTFTIYAQKALSEVGCRLPWDEKANTDSMNQQDRYLIPTRALTGYVTLRNSFKFLGL